MDGTFVSTSVITMVLIQITKRLRLKLDNGMLPLLSVVIAATINTLSKLGECGFDLNGFNVVGHLLQGMAAGFTASGGYDAINSLFTNKSEDDYDHQ